MTGPSEIARELNALIAHLVEVGLASDQNLAREVSGRTITFHNDYVLASAMRAASYRVAYDEMAASRAFNVKMPDGAFLQFMYEFGDNSLLRHRLAFYPSPYLIEFQQDSEIYMLDVAYAEIVASEVVPFPIRFDFDDRPGVFSVTAPPTPSSASARPPTHSDPEVSHAIHDPVDRKLHPA